MATLNDLKNDLQVLLEMADDPDVDQDTLYDTFDAVEGEFCLKAEGYAKVIREIEIRIAGRQSEIDRIQALVDADTNNLKRIKERLKWAMKETGNTKFNQGVFKFSIQKNGGLAPLAVDLRPEDLPEEFQKVKTVTEADNAKIREYLKDHTLEWARIMERGDRLVIK